MLVTVPYVFAILLLSFNQLFRVFAQQLSETSGWALRANQTCSTSESDCGPTANGFVGCCPASSPCLSQYNNVCCPPNTNCTDTLVAVGPWCADPTWVLCDNNGYFCCLPGLTCYNDSNVDGCAYRDYPLRPDQQVLPRLHQIPRSAASSSTTSSASSSTASSVSSSTASSVPSSTASSAASSSAAQKPTTGSTSSQDILNGLSTSDKIAIGVGVPGAAATLLGAWITWRLYSRQKSKDRNQHDAHLCHDSRVMEGRSQELGHERLKNIARKSPNCPRSA